jgi:uncharacterized protein with HEPN domain
MQPEERNPAYLWDMLQAAREVESMLGAHPEIPWREVIGQRNILAHEYGHIDYELLYKTATEDVPILIVHIEKLLPPLEDDGA